MSCVIAIDTATEACSVALVSGGEERVIERHLPRAHNKHLLAMVDEVMAGHSMADVTHLVAGSGPGSFTGLRIACATIQGLAWSRDIPVAGMCSLESQALQLLTTQQHEDGWLLSTIDAQINQLYGRWFRLRRDGLQAIDQPWIVPPDQIPIPFSDERDDADVVIAGSGCGYLRRGDGLPATYWYPDARPTALPMARRASSHPEALVWCLPRELAPHYVQQDVGWKKLSEQVKR